MTERQLQFRVGLFVLVSLGIAMVLVLMFGELQSYWQPTYAIAIHFEDAAGAQRGVPVRQNGLEIGTVREVRLDEESGGVLVIVDIKGNRKLRLDARPALVRSIFGDASIDFSLGTSPEMLPPNSRIKGLPPRDPLQIVERLDAKVHDTLTSFGETSREWQKLAANVNQLIDTKQGSLDEVVERAAEALTKFAQTMESAELALGNANRLLGNPELQESLRVTVVALPQMVEETRGTISAARLAIEKIGVTADSLNGTLDHMNQMTDPLAKATPSLVRKLDSSLGQLDTLLKELTTIARIVNQGEGTLSKLANDPSLYDNLNRSAASIPVVMRNLEFIVRDLRIFSDKIARHPEVLGVSGAINGSSGLKDPPEMAPAVQSIQRLSQPPPQNFNR